jgi:DNA topoisomerase-2
VEIAENYLAKLNGGEFQQIHPYYKGFKGKIIPLTETSYLTKGKYSIKSYKVIEITELPIGRWTNEYKEFLESLLVGKKKENNKDVGFLKSVKNGSTETSVYFEIEVSQDVLRHWAKDKTCMNENVDIIERELQLTSKVNLSNMHMFDEHNMIRKYSNVIEIMQHFFDVRYQHYIKRKDFLLNDLNQDITLLQQKVRFLDCVIRREIDVGRSTVEELETILQERQFIPLTTSEHSTPSYDYLIDIKIRTITVDNFQRLQKLLEEKMQEHHVILMTSIEDMWKHDLREFLDTYQRRACEVVMVDGQPTKVKLVRSKASKK